METQSLHQTHLMTHQYLIRWCTRALAQCLVKDREEWEDLLAWWVIWAWVEWMVWITVVIWVQWAKWVETWTTWVAWTWAQDRWGTAEWAVVVDPWDLWEVRRATFLASPTREAHLVPNLCRFRPERSTHLTNLWFLTPKTPTLLPSTRVVFVTRRSTTTTKRYYANRDAIFGFTGNLVQFLILNFQLKSFWFISSCRICTGLTEAAYHLLTAEVYAEWVCDKCYQSKSIPMVKFKPWKIKRNIVILPKCSIEFFVSPPHQTSENHSFLLLIVSYHRLKVLYYVVY